MKVYVEPPAHLSQAMFRVSRALARYAPAGVEIVKDPQQAEFHVLHVIANDAIAYAAARPELKFAVIQYCYKTAGEGPWHQLWKRASAVWSYYYLKTPNLYLSPLGIDPEFTKMPLAHGPRRAVLTTGYVAGPGAEAIEEVVTAATHLGVEAIHLGPQPVGLVHAPPMNWVTLHGITDEALAKVYQSCAWVSGLRHVEGFEMPCIEGLACGARPIVFDRSDMRRWYQGHAIFVPECSGVELTERLMHILSHPPRPVDKTEREVVLSRFYWETIIKGFWERAL